MGRRICQRESEGMGRGSARFGGGRMGGGVGWWWVGVGWGGMGAAIRWCRGGGGSMGEMVVGWGRYPAVSLVASLNRRLQAGIPMGCGCGGGRCPAVSLVASLNRRLRAGIPMGCWEGRKCGVVACGVVGAWKVDGFDACIVALSFGLCDEGSGAGVESGVARAIA